MNVRANLALMEHFGIEGHPLQQQDPDFWSGSSTRELTAKSSTLLLSAQRVLEWIADVAPANGRAELEATARELAAKTLAQIQTETAYTWARRACVAYWYAAAIAAIAANPQPTPEVSALVTRWLLDAQEYEHEALEHAALADNFPKKPGELDVLPQVRKIIGAGTERVKGG